jgi:hypothetical protein
MEDNHNTSHKHHSPLVILGAVILGVFTIIVSVLFIANYINKNTQTTSSKAQSPNPSPAVSGSPQQAVNYKTTCKNERPILSTNVSYEKTKPGRNKADNSEDMIPLSPQEIEMAEQIVRDSKICQDNSYRMALKIGGLPQNIQSAELMAQIKTAYNNRNTKSLF